jgi:hypothetical protein
MPYIGKSNRIPFVGPIVDLQTALLKVPRDKRKGELNYVISRLALGVFGRSYSAISDMVSALRDAATEIERRLMGPREDYAIGQNGDLPEYADDY